MGCGLRANVLSRFHHKGPVASKFASGLSRLRCNVGGLLQAQNKAENKRGTQGIASGYLEQPTTRTERQEGERLLKLSDLLVLELGAVGRHFEHSQ